MKKSSLIDVYVAAGGTLSEDGESVSFTPTQLKPLDLVVRVIPTQVQMENGAPALVTFSAVDLHAGYSIGDTGPLGTVVNQINYDAEITLPEDQLRILEPEVPFKKGRWWRVMRKGKLWAETSSEEEARSLCTKKSDVLQNLHTRTQTEWRDMPRDTK